jgi:hypothetical protein
MVQLHYQTLYTLNAKNLATWIPRLTKATNVHAYDAQLASSVMDDSPKDPCKS